MEILHELQILKQNAQRETHELDLRREKCARIDLLCDELIRMSPSDSETSNPTRNEAWKKYWTELVQLVSDLRTNRLFDLEKRHAKVPEEVMEWSRRHTSEKHFSDEIDEIRRTGGADLSSFIHELEQIEAGDG